MAKHGSKEDKARVKFRFFDFELEGSNAALEATVRTIATTLARRDGNGSSKALATSVVAALPNGHIVDADAEVENNADDAVEASVQPASRTKTSRPSVEQPKFLDDLDIKSAEVPLADFISTHYVGEVDWKRCVAIAKWFKQYMGIDTVTIDHIFTGYRIMNWTLPKRIRQPLNDATNKKQWFKRAGAGNFQITFIGEDSIQKIGL
jgi:hypothetical protein